MELYQWDANIKLEIIDYRVKEVHFSNALTEQAKKCSVYENNGKRYADIPNELLTEPFALFVYKSDGDNVIECEEIKVIKRAKPEDYYYDCAAAYVTTGTIEAEANSRMYKINHNLGVLPSRIIFYADNVTNAPSNTTAFNQYNEIMKAEAVKNDNDTYSNDSIYCTTQRMSYYSTPSAGVSYRTIRTVINTSVDTSNYAISNITETQFEAPHAVREGIKYCWIALA